MAPKRKYWLACGAAVVALPILPAAAQPRNINIPSEEAARSIPEFARQENIQIIAPVSQLHGINTPAVAGSMTLDEALRELLVGTGLEVASNDGATIVLRRAVAPTPVTGDAVRAEPELPPLESIVVTGSRVISDAASSPIPVTLVSTKQLRDTTPSNLADGLNKLPIFQGSQSIGRPGDGSGNYSSNVLNLRNFGVQRTLVLLDGHRAPPSNSDGTVDIDTLPQMLVARVDIVTGGASAVYGSDAVTGVVNFVLDKRLDGLKIDANEGISTFGDAAGYNLGVAGGTELLGGRGHIEGSLEYRHRDPVNQYARPYGPPANYEALVGTGAASNPFAYIANGRRPNSSIGGVVQGCVPACPQAAGTQFAGDGALSPFHAGIAGAHDANGNVTAGTGNLNSGGDGAYSPYGTLFDGYHQGTLFSRFSYELADNVSFYLQGSASEAYSFGWYFPQKITPGAGQTDLFYKNNAFLPAAVQAQLGNDGTNPLQNAAANPAVQPGNTFQLGKFLISLGQDELNAAASVNRVLSLQTGFDGTILNSRFNWSIFYTHAENRLAEDLVNNQNYQKEYAASDAVLLPNGNVACYASTEGGAIGQAYANCVPLDPFGPTAVTRQAFDYFAQLTDFRQTNVLDNMGASVAGHVFDGWGAGPVTAALSAEARFNNYTVTTNAPITTVDCTGLRLCSSLLPLFAQPVLAPVHASNNVWEVALETEVPVLKGAPLIEQFNLNLAGRYTDYSTSGRVQTWKIGFDWNVIDSLRLRGTTSTDIRAPELSDLFQPPTVAVTGFTDIHTAYTTTLFNVTQGNPNLLPEVSRTYTIGTVWTPDFLSGLTMSLDYYQIHMRNAIGQVIPTNNTVQNLCESSGGTSPYCALYQRPLPFSDRSIANFPSKIFTLNLNTASVETEGFDFEANYGWQMSDLVSDWKGSWTGRLLATYQPVLLQSVAFPGAPSTRSPDPHTRFTGFLSYVLEDWTLGLEDRWVSGFSLVAGPVTAIANNWVDPHVRSWNTLDLNISRNFEMEGIDMTGYFVVQNLFNAPPDYVPNATIGQIYPVFYSNYNGVQDPMGRYVTIGIRADL